MKAARHAMILDLIETFNIETQDDLAMRLKDRGINVTQATVSRDIKELRLIKVLAEDGVDQGPDGFEVRTAPADLHAVGAKLEAAGLPLGEQKWTFVPQNTVKVEGDNARRLLKLMDALDDNDDVQHVHANFEIDESLMESLST